MIASTIKLLNLFVQVASLGGVVGLMNKASSLCPNAIEEPPYAANEPNLKGCCIEVFLVWIARGVKRLHCSAPSTGDPTFKDVEPSNLRCSSIATR